MRFQLCINVCPLYFYSRTRDLIVGDGYAPDSRLLLFPHRNGILEAPRVLCDHGSRRRVQKTHVHARLSDDGKQMLFTSDKTGSANLYLADVLDVETLPLRQP